jgi:hypothetical protein
MHGYDVLKALYLNCEIHSPWVRCSGPMVGPIWPYSENVLNLRKMQGTPTQVALWIFYHCWYYHLNIRDVILSSDHKMQYCRMVSPLLVLLKSWVRLYVVAWFIVGVYVTSLTSSMPSMVVVDSGGWLDFLHFILFLRKGKRINLCWNCVHATLKMNIWN